MTEELLSTVGAASILGVTSETVRRWARSGRLPVADASPGNRQAKFTRAAVLALKKSLLEAARERYGRVLAPERAQLLSRQKAAKMS